VFVVSRRAARVTELVTPLKPLEAMAMGQALVVSDLPALAEIVEHEKTGLSYRAGDPADLAAQCARLIDQPDLRRRVAQAALQWVRENRTWSHTLRELYLAYDKARKNNAGRT
jgi:glycosyltransferase involved in cell wall biosynthesis